MLPLGIRMMWEHPQRLLSSVATREFTWGAAEQALMEEFMVNAAAAVVRNTSAQEL